MGDFEVVVFSHVDTMLLANAPAIQVFGSGTDAVHGVYVREDDDFKMGDFEVKYMPEQPLNAERKAGWYVCFTPDRGPIETYYFASAPANMVPLSGWVNLADANAGPPPQVEAIEGARSFPKASSF